LGPGGLHYCFQQKTDVEVPDITEYPEQFYAAGFVCKPYSGENQNRHKHKSLEDMFDVDGKAGKQVHVLGTLLCFTHVG
jgi:hypothetical protein